MAISPFNRAAAPEGTPQKDAPAPVNTAEPQRVITGFDHNELDALHRIITHIYPDTDPDSPLANARYAEPLYVRDDNVYIPDYSPDTGAMFFQCISRNPGIAGAVETAHDMAAAHKRVITESGITTTFAEYLDSLPEQTRHAYIDTLDTLRAYTAAADTVEAASTDLDHYVNQARQLEGLSPEDEALLQKYLTDLSQALDKAQHARDARGEEATHARALLAENLRGNIDNVSRTVRDNANRSILDEIGQGAARARRRSEALGK